MFSHFFIQRPVFAAVVSILITLMGALAMTALPVARYPELAPPTINVRASYPGANAQVVAETVANPIEEEVNGVENMLTMSSVSANDGSMSLTVTFQTGTDLDIANVLVQNRVSVAESRLPEEVRRRGVNVRKRSTDVVMYVGFFSPDGRYDDTFISNYVTRNVKNELSRVDGVGDVTVFGVGDFSMRVWLDPDRLAALNMSADQVVNSIRDQNVQVAAGVIGGAPAPAGIATQYIVTTQGRLEQPGEFEQIVLRTDDDGSIVTLGEVARVELGAETYNYLSQFRGKPSATVAIYQIPGANLLSVANLTKQTLEEQKKSFPQGLDYFIAYDSTDVVTASIEEVVETLFITLILVILTVYIFLQDFRATLIPAATIPVSLVGTFAALLVLGYSINQMTLFGLVLVIGIVVDDAIVVVENTSRHLANGLSAKEAAMKAMKEISGAVIATTLVLLAVFVPTIFMGGITGTLFRQFAVTISIATVFSSINALTLSPALCALILKPPKAEPRGFFKLFDNSLDRTRKGYLGVVGIALRRAVIGLIVFAALTVSAIMGLGSLPTGFVPQEDEGYCMVNFQLPEGATIERTKFVMDEINSAVEELPAVKSWLTVGGFSIFDQAASSAAGFAIITFDNWSERTSADLSMESLINQLNAKLAQFQDTVAFAFAPPSLPGVGISSGFTYMLQDRGGVGLESLSDMANTIIDEGNAQTGLTGLSTPYRANTPQLYLDVDREQLTRMGIPLGSLFSTLQIYLGSAYVNDFTLLGNIFRVTAQADAPFRAQPEDIGNLRIPGAGGTMVPISSVTTIEETLGPQTVTRFNVYPAIRILGEASPGFSSGQALGIMENMSASILPPSMGYAWADLSLQEKLATGSATTIFILAVVLVYLVLAAQYESWTIPISVCLSVPTAILGAVLGCYIRGFDNNVYTQIGIVLLIGLATKSAILIVEFAKTQRESGMSTFDAALSAANLRFRAVLMTAFSFILGVIPLVIAAGAGAVSRQVLGTVVFVGMLVATVVSLVCVPMLYFLVQTAMEKLTGKKPEAKETVKS